MGLSRWNWKAKIGSWILIFAGMSESGLGAGFVGKPPIERFEIPLQVYPSHFAIEQTADGRVHVGSHDGILSFDGERWSLLKTNGQLVRSLATTGNRLYVGGYDTYGYVDRDPGGYATYTDLSAQRAATSAPDGFADIWRIAVTDDGVFFVALHHVFTFDPETGQQRYLSHPGRFGGIAQCNGKTWLQFRGEGFRRWIDGAWQPMPHTNSLNELISIVLPESSQSCLALGNSGLHRLTESSVERLPLPDRTPLQWFHQGIRLPDGSLAVSTSVGQVFLLSANDQQWRTIPVHSGFLTDIDYNDGALLVAATTTIYRFAWPNAFSTFGTTDARRSSLTGARQVNDRLLLFSDADVWQLPDQGGAAAIQPLQLTQSSSYDWLAVDGTQLLAEGHALVELAAAPRVVDPSVYPRLLVADRFRTSSVFVGTEHGLRQMRKAGGWTLQPDPAPLDGMLVTSLVQPDRHSVWIGSRNGVWRHRLDDSGRVLAGVRVELPQSDDPEAHIYMDGEQLIASNARGIYAWDNDRFLPEPRFSDLIDLRTRSDEALQLVIDPHNKRRWAFTSTELFTDRGQWRSIPFRYSNIGPIIEALPINASTLLVVGLDGVMQYQDHLEAPHRAVAKLQFTSVTMVTANGSERPLPLAPQDRVSLAPDDIGVRFQFALSGLRTGKTLYRGRLFPYEQEFSEWASSAGYTYTRLRPGEYELEVQARDEHGTVLSMPPYRIAFSPKWHELTTVRIMASALAVALLAVLGWLMYRHRTRVLRRLVAERTEALAQANRKLSDLAHQDALTQIPNRRRFDEYFSALWSTCGQNGRHLALLLIDVDHFKAYNDRHGHAAGDDLLRALARVLAAALRRNEDLIARYGGEEFAVIMPGAQLDAAVATGELLRKVVANANLDVSVSIGVASAKPSLDPNQAELFERADKALYRAKEGGRNRVESD